jgi:transposase-like protein
VKFLTKWRQAQKYANHVSHPLIHYLRNKDRASHILLLDAIFIKVKGEERAVLIAYDTVIGVINYWIDESENIAAYSLIYQQLEKVGYKPICVVSDKCISIVKTTAEKKYPHQYCVFHLLKTLRAWLTVSGEFRYPKDKLLFNRIHHIFMTEKIEDVPRRIERFRVFQSAFNGREDIFKMVLESCPKCIIASFL